MAHVRRTGWLAVLALAWLGCVRQVPGRGELTPTIEGHWGTTHGETGLELMISVRGKYVSGSGLLNASGRGATPLAVRGEYVAPTFSLQFASHDQIVARYLGRLAPNDTMRGVLEDVGPFADSLILVRRPGGVNPRLFAPKW